MNTVQVVISEFEEIYKQKYYFLGTWCFNKDQQKYLKNKNIIINEIYSKNEVEKYYSIYRNLFDKILNSLTDKLNRYHNINNEKQYWEILLGPWLETYLTTYLDRYRNILNIKNNYSDADIYLVNNKILKELIFEIEDSQHFTQMIGNDFFFNYFIHSEIAKEIIDKKNLKENIDLKINYKKFKYRKFTETKSMRYFKLIYNNFVVFILSKLNKKIIYFNQNYIKNLQSIKISLFLKKIFLQFYIINDLFKTDNFDKIRNHKLKITDNSEIAQIISKHIMKYVPACYIEQYDTLVKNSKKYYPFKIKNYFTLTGMMYSESLKHKIGLSKKNINLILGQHGGPVNITVGHPQTDHELSICDYYITWGWKKKFFENKCFPITSSFFFKEKIILNKDNSSILWLTNSHPHHIKYFNNFTLNFNEYLISQKKFYENLNANIKKHIKIRYSYDIHDWSLKEYYQSFIPTNNFDTMMNSFNESVSISKIFVCDLPGTTFAELLSMNLPVIAFWKPDWFAYTDQSERIFKKLEDAKILFNNYKDASDHLNNVYEDIDIWWNTKKTQEAINTYTKNYAYRSESYLNEWKKFLNKF